MHILYYIDAHNIKLHKKIIICIYYIDAHNIKIIVFKKIFVKFIV